MEGSRVGCFPKMGTAIILEFRGTEPRRPRKMEKGLFVWGFMESGEMAS
jgi:hypothetical protein